MMKTDTPKITEKMPLKLTLLPGSDVCWRKPSLIDNLLIENKSSCVHILTQKEFYQPIDWIVNENKQF